jgi:hypothetical protein
MRVPTSCSRKKKSGFAKVSKPGVRGRFSAFSGSIKLRAERQARRERMGKVNLQLDAGDKSGKLVAELEHVSKGLRSTPLLCAIFRRAFSAATRSA